MGGMEIGISTASYFPKLYTEQTIEHIAALGTYGATEIHRRTFIKNFVK